MAPPTTAPRLRDIDPAALAHGVAQAALSHLSSLTMQIAGVHYLAELPEPEHTEIYRSVRALAGYARGDHPLEHVAEHLITLIPLYQAALGQAPDVDDDPDTELGIVIRAALARERLEDGHALSTGDLAALGGMAQRAVALLMRRGEIRAEQDDGGAWRVRAREARRWLAARGAL